ncbi:hypothetical protein ACHHYP_07335 [Achlya hypogyna]|uniref:Uncharacterized protein n=1 Tax=Achlya hypogyna TaxID=1202772 RepID=A0A1V9ZLX8_ACHHY|nr:hypothetical protein ACHHYP_07335 [Achlya hypogyna]
MEHRQRNATPDAPIPFVDANLEQIMESRLLELQRDVEARQAKVIPRVLPRLPEAEFCALVDRTSALVDFTQSKAILTNIESVVQAKVERADAVAEDLREKVEDLYQLTPELDFDARALRWRAIVATRTQSEVLRKEADAALLAFERTELRHPYSELTALPTFCEAPVPNNVIATRDVWLIGRRGTEVNSDSVVYYGAYLPTSPNGSGSNNSPLPGADERPLDDLRWLTCSAAAAEPSPVVSFRKGTVEAWDVRGAGMELANGIYVLSGRFEHANKYTSVAGLELFRKRFSMATQAFGASDIELSPDAIAALSPNSAGLPLKFRAHYTEQDFHVLAQIGSWLATQEVKAKTQMEAVKESHRKVQTHIVQDQGSNVTIQAHQAQDMPLVPSRATAVPLICRAWVLQQCHVPQCAKRHYYISHAERDALTRWQEATEAQLDLDALKAITGRELLLDRARAIGVKAMSKYQGNMMAESTKQVQKLLGLLQALRLANVLVIEAIGRWRNHAQASGRLSLLHTASEGEEAKLGWSVSITVFTGRQLYKGSNAFVSKVKRFCRDADVEAEAAYDNAVVTEARRLHTTVDHIPPKRYLVLSCGVHCAIESDVRSASKAKAVCVECRAKSQAKSEPWIPTYLWHNLNYILKAALHSSMGSDIAFLEDITPLRLYVGPGFPLAGNPFLIPQSDIQDPKVFVELAVPAARAPELLPDTAFTRHSNDLVTWTHPETDATYIANPHHRIRLQSGSIEQQYEVLDMHRLVEAQKDYLRELSRNNLLPPDAAAPAALAAPTHTSLDDEPTTRIVQALYWDRCAALRIEQVRPKKAFKLANVWCRTDVGEWAGFRVRGKHIRHHFFDTKLQETGKKNIHTRALFVQRLRSYMQQPLELLERATMVTLLAEAEIVRGDLVHLEAENLRRFLTKYDRMTAAAVMLQLWWRRKLAVSMARARALALRVLAQARLQFQALVTTLAESFYAGVVASASRQALRTIRDGCVTTSLKLDGEHVVVSYHSLEQYDRVFDTVDHARVPCSHCLRMLYHRRIQFRDFAFRLYDDLCCCRKVLAPERLLVRAYNPATNDVYRVLVGNERLRQLLRPHTDGNLRRACDLQPLPTDRILRYDPKQPGGRVRTCWEPIKEATAAHVTARGIEILAARAEAIAQAHWTQYNACRALHTNNLHVKKHSWATYQKAHAQVSRSLSMLATATTQAKEAVAFSEKGRTTFAGEASWDPLENANNWRLLVAKRQSTRDVAEKEAQFEAARTAWFHAEMNEASARALTAKAKERYDAAASEAKRARLLANDYRAMATAAQLMLQSAMRVLGSLLTLRQWAPAPIRRTLVFLDKPMLQHFHANPTKLHTTVGRRRFAYNLVAAKARSISMELIPHDARRSELWVIQVRVLAESTVLDEGVLVTAYRPSDARLVDTWVDWRFLHLLVDCPRFRDPLQATFTAQHAIAATRTQHGNAMMRKRLVMTARAFILIALVRLNSFTGDVAIGRLEFFRVREVLHARLAQSHWWADVLAGRKRGRGDEVYRQAANVDGHRCHVLIYENWGDLRVQVYEPRRRNDWVCNVPLAASIAALRASPELLGHWLACVRTNRYSDAVFASLLQHLRIDGRRLSFEKRRGSVVWRGGRFVSRRYVLVTLRQDAWEGLLLHVTGVDPAEPICGRLYVDAVGRRKLFPHDEVGDTYDKLVAMVALAPVEATCISSDGQNLAEAIDTFNKWITATSRWRNPRKPFDNTDTHRWACAVDSCALRKTLATTRTIVLRRELALEDKASACIWTSDAHLDDPLVRAKIEVFRCHGEFALRLRRELFHEWEERQEAAHRASMAAEEVSTRQAIAQARRRAVQVVLENTRNRLEQWSVDLERSTAVCRAALETQLQRQCNLHAMKWILSMGVQEKPVSEEGAPREYLLTIGHGVQWLEAAPYLSSTTYFKPVTTIYRPDQSATLATTTVVGNFARPLQFFVYIYSTENREVWRVEAYCKTIGAVVRHFASVTAFLEEMDHHVPPVLASQVPAAALRWLAGFAFEPPMKSPPCEPHDLWKLLAAAQQVSELRYIFQCVARLDPYNGAGDLLQRSCFSDAAACGVARRPVVQAALMVLACGMARGIESVDALPEDSIAAAYSELQDPFALPPIASTATSNSVVEAAASPIPPLATVHNHTMILPADEMAPIEELFVPSLTVAVAASLLGTEDVISVPALHGTLFVVVGAIGGPNLRAMTLAVDSNREISGVAIYATNSESFHDRVLQTVWTSRNAPAALQRRATRKLAPWRVYASDRIRLARAAKPLYRHLPLAAPPPASAYIPGTPPSAVVESFVEAVLSCAALEYLQGWAAVSGAGTAPLAELAVQRFHAALDGATLRCGPLDATLVYDGTHEVPTDAVAPGGVAAPTVALRVRVHVNRLERPTALVVDANGASASYRATIDAYDTRALCPPPRYGPDWAALAALCIPLLAVRHRNGRAMLVFHGLTPPLASALPPIKHPAPATVGFLAFPRPVPPCASVDALADAMVLRRLQKHALSSVQARMAARQRATVLHSAQAALEWAAMEREAAQSAADRGFLTLPTKTLHKLKGGYDKALGKALATEVGRVAEFRRELASQLGLPDDVVASAVGLPAFSVVAELWRAHHAAAERGTSSRVAEKALPDAARHDSTVGAL